MKNIQSNNILIKLIKNNTGYSSKNFFLIVITIVSTLLLCMPITALIIDMYNNKTVTMSWNDIGMYIGSIAAMVTGVGISKAWSEKYERLPGPDGILGTEDDIYVKKCSAFEYVKEPPKNNMQCENDSIQYDNDSCNVEF